MTKKADLSTPSSQQRYECPGQVQSSMWRSQQCRPSLEGPGQGSTLSGRPHRVPWDVLQNASLWLCLSVPSLLTRYAISFPFYKWGNRGPTPCPRSPREQAAPEFAHFLGGPGFGFILLCMVAHVCWSDHCWGYVNTSIATSDTSLLSELQSYLIIIIAADCRGAWLSLLVVNWKSVAPYQGRPSISTGWQCTARRNVWFQLRQDKAEHLLWENDSAHYWSSALIMAREKLF